MNAGLAADYAGAQVRILANVAIRQQDALVDPGPLIDDRVVTDYGRPIDDGPRPNLRVSTDEDISEQSRLGVNISSFLQHHSTQRARKLYPRLPVHGIRVCLPVFIDAANIRPIPFRDVAVQRHVSAEHFREQIGTEI